MTQTAPDTPGSSTAADRTPRAINHRHMKLGALVASTVLAATLLACGGDLPTGPQLPPDTPARLDPSSPTPVYPPTLRIQGISGAVVMEFVVDTLGRVEDSTVKVVSSTDPLFTQAVLADLPQLHFFPATRHGHKIRQLVELPFTFTVVRSGSPIWGDVVSSPLRHT